ncbi:MAG: DUF4838 domain-containing protein [Bacteroidia bacterium]
MARQLPFCPPNRLAIAALWMCLCLLLPAVSAQKNKKNTVSATQPSLQGIVLAEPGGLSRYRIIIPTAPTEWEIQAAEVLKSYLLQIAGVALPILKPNEGLSAYEIVLGQNERLDQNRIHPDWKTLGEDGFTILTDSLRLVIAGGSKKGTLYGVYSFLEKYLDCRMYAPKVKVIPKRETIILPVIREVQVPAILFRDTHYRVTWDQEYTDWHKLDHDPHGERTDWGMWVHTFHALVPPDIYFKNHPEYFSEVNGKRIPTQLCLSNPDVLEITIQNLRRRIAQNPSATYWSVSQNDNRNYCTCEKCRATDEREGSPSGSIVQFVNQVADQFPDKMISTLAYEYGRKAPKTLIPRENVNIMLCSIEINRDKPIASDPTCEDFKADVEAWGKIAKDIIIWDYVVQFNNLISPFPNLHVLQPNLRFFAENGVTTMFEQGNREVGGEFAELRAYLISKLMWNPYANADSIMNDFLTGYYGAAAGFIRSYIDEMRNALLASGKPLRIFGGPTDVVDGYLSPEKMQLYQSLFDQAESSVAGDHVLLERVRIARLPLMYAEMEQAKKVFYGPGGIFQQHEGRWEASARMRAMIDPFSDLCVRQGVTRVKNGALPGRIPVFHVPLVCAGNEWPPGIG